MGRLARKRALVTGAGAGIGRATTIKFAEESAYVIATDANGQSLAGLEAHGVAELSALDVTDTAAIKALADKTGTIDVLFNCAAIVHHGTILDASEADWDRLFDVNVKSIHRMISAFLPGMLEAGSGSIINVSSAASSVRGIPNRYIYGATKAAVIGLTKAVAADFIKRGIRCNAICPGTIQSPSLEGRIANQAVKEGRAVEQIRQAFVDRQPMGRLGTPEEIAWLAVYLASDEASYTTGQIHIADGGFAL
jgi:2-keto-3-deoxy-L-fuconate dehydrogenase